jgi:hypothetical protein
LKHGDRNSKFFHLSTIVRRRRNNISEIKLEDGSRLLERKEIENYFMEKFKDLYSSENPHVPEELARLFRKEISDEENVELCRVPTNEEIRKVVWEMHPLKAPGPDGLPALFDKHYWSIVGDQVIEATQSFFRNGWMLKELNQTFITLILKIHGAHTFGQFKPISLCNV